jgi:hypothetical protein
MYRQKLAKLKSAVRKTKAPGVRLVRFSRQTKELAYELIREGLTQRALVEVVGVSAATANRWCKEAKDYREVKVLSSLATDVGPSVISLRLLNGMIIECADSESLAQVLERLDAVS